MQVALPTVKEEIVQVPVQELTVHVPKTIQQECVTDQCAERTVEVAVPKVQQQAAMVQVLVPTVKEEIVHVPDHEVTVHVSKTIQQEWVTDQYVWRGRCSSKRPWCWCLCRR